MKQIILHVGPHKTGTTAIQLAYFRGRRVLAQNGVCYPMSGSANAAHHGLVDWSRRWGDNFDADQLRAEVEPYPTVVISSENFAHLDVADLLRAREALSFGKVTVLFYLRRLVDLWPSHWQELVKHGQALSFRDYISDAALETVAAPFYFRLDQFQQLQRFNEAFGAENVRVVGYDMLRENGVDLAVDLLQRFDPALASIALPKVDANASRVGWQTSFLRLFNKLWAERFGRVAPFQLRVALLQRLKDQKIGWIDGFREDESKWLRPINLSSSSFLSKNLQERFVATYSGQFQDDAAAVTTAYLAEKKRIVHDVQFPLQMSPELLRSAQGLLSEIAAELEAG